VSRSDLEIRALVCQTLEDSLEDKLEKELAAEAEKAEAEGKETEADDMKVCSIGMKNLCCF
jgi:hypothetical protein